MQQKYVQVFRSAPHPQGLATGFEAFGRLESASNALEFVVLELGRLGSRCVSRNRQSVEMSKTVEGHPQLHHQLLGGHVDHRQADMLTLNFKLWRHLVKVVNA